MYDIMGQMLNQSLVALVLDFHFKITSHGFLIYFMTFK